MTVRTCVVRPGDTVDTSRLGGKAGSLWRLAEVGFPVPRFAVVTTDAYRAVAATAEVRAAVGATGSGLPDDEVVALVDRAFLTAPLPDGLRDEIVAAAREVAGTGGALAVRSSATAEDLRGASFAGQYRSFLDVPADDRVVEAVRRTWASLWYPAALRYREEHGTHDLDPGDGPAMAVVLMQLVRPVLAGVAFTVDPAGDVGDVRIETVRGFADRLVSGEETPEVTLVPRDRLDHVPGVAADVAALAVRAESTFGCPQDVEWVWDGTQVELVQSRPITVSGEHDDDGFDRAAPASACTTAGIAEMLPGFLPPLVWDTIGHSVDEAFMTLFADLDALPPDVVGALARVRGQAAVDLSLLDRVAAAIPGVDAATFEEQLLGTTRPHGAPTGAPAPTHRSHVAHDVRVASLQRRAVAQSDITTIAIGLILDAAPDLSPLTDDELLGYRSRLVSLLARTVQAEVGVAAAAAAAHDRLVHFLAAYEPGAADELAGRLTRRTADSAGLRTWSEFASLLQRSPAGRAALSAGDPDRALQALRSAPDPTLVDAFERTLRTAGSRAVAAGPTWSEDLGAAWRMVTAAAGRRHSVEPTAHLDEVRERLRSTQRWRRLRLLTGVVIDSQSVMLRRRVQDATGLLGRREDVKASVLALGGEVRRVHLEIGHRLVERRRIDHATDVDLLGADELQHALAAGGPDRVELLRRRRRGEQAARSPLPLRFVGRPAPGATPMPDGDRFSGWPASPGTYEGVARVVTSSSDHLERDEVLVARTTDPSWGPLFLTAGALVIEQGGPLSHASVVARELGLPAVVNVPGIVNRVRTGDRLLVDGTSGTVVVETPSVPAPTEPPRDEGVFVPAVMGAGLLFSLIVLVRDWLDRIVGTSRRQANAAAQARLLAHEVLHGDDAPDGVADRRRRRRVLLTLAGALLGVAAYLVPGAIGNYFRPGGYLAEIGWVLAATAALTAGSVALGTVLAMSAMHPDRPSPAALRALRMSDATLHTPLFDGEPVHHEWGHRWHGTASITLLLLTVSTAVLTLAVEMGSPGLLEWDTRLGRSLRDTDPTTMLEPATWLGHPAVAVGAALAVAVVMRRRRTRLAVAHPAAVAAAFGLTFLLAAVVDRIGPTRVGAVARSATYPDATTVHATVVTMMVAVAVAVVARRRWPGVLVGVLLGSVTLVGILHHLAVADVWPSDVLAGALLGLLVSSAALLAAGRAPVEEGHRPRLLVVPERLAVLVHRAADVWVVAAVVVFVVLAVTVGIPDNPYAGLGVPALKRTVQLAALVLVAIAALVARRWLATGSIMLAVAGTVMAVVASIEYEPTVALAVAVTFLLPAFGYWVSWQHGRPLRSLVAPAVVCAVLVTGTWVGASSVYEKYFGPTHPLSTLTTFSTDRTLWVWAGALGDHSVTVNARLRIDDVDATATIRLVEADEPSRVITPASVTRTGRTLSARFDGLAADTEHHYAVLVDGHADLPGAIRTAPSGAASFTVTFGSCARTASNGVVYETIAAQHPLLHIVTGDLHYGDVSTDDPARLRTVLDGTIGAPAQQALYLSTAIAYVWDDHDYGGNDAGADSPARTMAQTVYREYVPHVPLPSDEGIQQAFTIGRVRFVLTDLRSYRRSAGDGSGEMMGTEELAWFEQELIAARDAGEVVVWVNPTPWIGGDAPGSDTWAGFPQQRRLIADFLVEAGIDRILMLSGDAHMIAIDDGTNSDYSTDGSTGFVVAHGGAFDRPGSRKGGPYSEGAFPGGGQFGVLQVVDDGGPSISFVVSGRNWQDREIVRYEFTL